MGGVEFLIFWGRGGWGVGGECGLGICMNM